MALAAAGIRLYGGVSGSADAAVQSLLGRKTCPMIPRFGVTTMAGIRSMTVGAMRARRIIRGVRVTTDTRKESLPCPTSTKKALESSLKKLMLKKPLDKITIRDVTEDCGISRAAFYYHFQDIYDLIEWSCIEDARAGAAGEKDLRPTGRKALAKFLRRSLENKPFVLNAYRCISRETDGEFSLSSHL